MDAGLSREVEAIERDAWADLYAAPPQAFKNALGLRQQRFGEAIALAAKNVASAQFNRAFGFCADGPSCERDIDEAFAFMRANAAARWVAQCVDDHACAWLEARGFTRTDHPWVKMARRREAPPRIETSLSIGEIGADDAEAFGAVVCAGYGSPPALASWFTALAGRKGWKLYLGRDGAVPAAAAAMYIDGDTAWLGIDATDPRFRRRGGQGALMQRRIEDAIIAGVRIIAIETGAPKPGASNSSYENMLRTGFFLVHERPTYAPPSAP